MILPATTVGSWPRPRELLRLQLLLGALQIVLHRRDSRSRRFARAHGVLVRIDQEAQIFPTFDELRERVRRKQYGRVAQVAVFVNIHEPALERIIVERERFLRRIELNRVPIDLPARRFGLRVEVAKANGDVVNRRIGLIELRLQIVLVRRRLIQFDALLVKPRLQRLTLLALRFDALLQIRRSRDRKRRREGEHETESKKSSYHWRRLSLT